MRNEENIVHIVQNNQVITDLSLAYKMSIYCLLSHHLLRKAKKRLRINQNKIITIIIKISKLIFIENYGSNVFLLVFLALEIECCLFLSKSTILRARPQFSQYCTILDQSNCGYFVCY